MTPAVVVIAPSLCRPFPLLFAAALVLLLAMTACCHPRRSFRLQSLTSLRILEVNGIDEASPPVPSE